MGHVRPPAVAGHFYPSDPDHLLREVMHYLDEAEARVSVPKAIIVPHAGYAYSGAVAATAYACIKARASDISRVVLLGPAHHTYVRGVALSSADTFTTPLGPIRVDPEAIRAIQVLPQVIVMDEAHRLEHSLEVQLPFLQVTLSQFKLVPLVVGDCGPEEVRQVLEVLWDEEENLTVVSSDLSHYHDYETAKSLDAATSEAIKQLRVEAIHPEQACGCMPVRGLLDFARHHGLKVTTLETKNSGDTAGPRDQVVGYGAYALH